MVSGCIVFSANYPEDIWLVPKPHKWITSKEKLKTIHTHPVLFIFESFPDKEEREAAHN